MDTHQKIKIFCIGLVGFAFIFFTLLILPLGPYQDDSKSLSNDQYRIWKGSDFKYFENKVYISVPSNGYYEIEAADINSLEPVEANLMTRRMAKDNQNVYCGNLILKDLNPEKVKWLGDGYLSDGRLTYYCSGITEPNPNLNKVLEVFQIIFHEMGLMKKPQNYWYPMVLLESSDEPYQMIADDMISNGRYTYKDGKLTETLNTQEKTEYLPLYLEDSDSVRVDDHYYRNGDHVFYETQKLAIKPSPSLRVYRHDDHYYLNDPVTGQFYFEDQAFPTENLPYKILTRLNDHTDYLIFESSQGLFAIDQKSRTLSRLGDNPFLKEKLTLAPDVWVSGNRTYFLGVYKKYKRSKNGVIPCFEATRLYVLKNTPKQVWIKIIDVKHDIWVHGSLWQKGDQYFYFDERGKGQQFQQAIYAITTENAVQQLKSDIRSDGLNALLFSEQLIPLMPEDYVQIKEKLNFCF